MRGKTLDQLYHGYYSPGSEAGRFPDDRVTALLLRAGAVPVARREFANRYIGQVIAAGGFEAYERKQAKALVAMLTPKFPQLPEELIPTIVRYAFHPGMYASSGVPTLTPAQAERIFISLDLHPSSFSLDSPYRFMLDAMFRRGVDPEILNRRGSEFKWVPPPPEHHGRQPWPHELKCAYELHLSTVESLRRFHEEEYRREYESRLLS